LNTDQNLSLRLRLYRSMRLIRRAEEALIAEYHPADEMRCPIHFCVGQEAAPAALGLTLQKDDAIVSHYRSHGYYIAKGAPLAGMVAEFYGKASGANSGLGGSMELAHHESKFYSGAIVGGPAGLANGSAFAQKYLGSDAITIAVFGDGAMDEGIAYEVINLAVLRQLPVLFLCENNRYAAHTALTNRTRAPSITGRAGAFGIATESVEDSDPEVLYRRLAAVVSAVRRDRRPFFLEVGTYRYCGHVGPESDDAMGYRPAAELRQRMNADPLLFLRKLIESTNARSELQHIDAEIEAEIIDAIARAKKAGFPDYVWAQSIICANTYDPVVTELTEGPVGQFKGAQSEAKLAPY
jgi:TPP-dependent pyruvate/acetoin dehydrogenase alpha subunit